MHILELMPVLSECETTMQLFKQNPTPDWQCTLVITGLRGQKEKDAEELKPAFRRQRKADLCKFRPAWFTE